MDQFVIPQFIDVEDKIFGPVTTRQFIILLSTSLLLFIIYKLADTTLFIFLLAFFGVSALILAFVKINGQPFHYFILNIAQTMRRPSRRIWRHDYTKEQLKELQERSKVEPAEVIKRLPRVSYNRMRDLSLIVNTGGYYKAEQ
ncbi:MAG: PrgI family protein [bacterium]